MKYSGIYVMINPAFPHLLKIGYSKDVKKREDDLSHHSGVPSSFHTFLVYTGVAELSDTKAHDLITILNPSLKYNKNREFFLMTPEQANAMFESLGKIHGTSKNITINPFNDPYIEEILDEMQCNKKGQDKSPKKPALTFSVLGIAAGEELTFIKDDTIKVYVHSDLRHVIYKDEKISMSKLATRFLGAKNQVAGTLYFLYKGKRLTDIGKEKGIW